MNERIRDRGTKKWTSLFLPEHVATLRQLNGELDREQKPVVDEFMRVEFEERVNYAMEWCLTVNFRVWSEADGVTSAVIGEVHRADVQGRGYYVETDDGFVRVPFADVVGVEVDEE